MKQHAAFILFLLMFTFPGIVGAQANFPLFDSTWYGFATGTYPYGQTPSAIQSADLDNDGDNDLVVSLENKATGFVALLNQGKGQYSAPISFPSQAASKDIVVADFNNDGRKDIAVTNSGMYLEGNTISVFLNKKTGKPTPVTYTVGTGPVGIVAGDFDGDNDMDIAVANNMSFPGTVSILINTGNGTFNPAINVPAGNYPYKLTLSKINNDSLVDIVVGNEKQKMNILFNTGNNLFSNRLEKNVLTLIWSADGQAHVKAADFDKDGDNDIIYSSSQTWNGDNGQIALFRNQGNGVFGNYELINLAYFTVGPIDMDVADLNKDGYPDIVTTNYSGRIGDGFQLVLNDGTGHFLPAAIKPCGQGTWSLTAAEVTGDANVDVVTVDSYSLQVTVHKNYGNAAFRHRRCTTPTTAQPARSMRLILMATAILILYLLHPASVLWA